MGLPLGGTSTLEKQKGVCFLNRTGTLSKNKKEGLKEFFKIFELNN